MCSTRSIAALLLLTAACASAPPKRKAAPPPAPAASQPAPPPPADFSFDSVPEAPPKPLLTLGLSAPVGKAVAEQSQIALTAYLMQELGGDTATRVFPDGDQLAAALVAGEVEAAWLTPVAYVRASAKTPLKPIVKMSRHGFTNYRSVFFVKKGAKAKKLTDMKGKKAAFVARASASGRLYPQAHLRKIGKDPAKFFGQIVDLSDHREVCLAVLEGKVDVGVTLSDEVKPGAAPIPDGCREAGLDPAKFAVIERTDPIPNDVIAFRSDTPDLIVNRVRDALVALGHQADGPQQLDAIFQADGFAPADDGDFRIVREMDSGAPAK